MVPTDHPLAPLHLPPVHEGVVLPTPLQDDELVPGLAHLHVLAGLVLGVHVQDKAANIQGITNCTDLKLISPEAFLGSNFETRNHDELPQLLHGVDGGHELVVVELSLLVGLEVVEHFLSAQ